MAYLLTSSVNVLPSFIRFFYPSSMFNDDNMVVVEFYGRELNGMVDKKCISSTNSVSLLLRLGVLIDT